MTLCVNDSGTWRNISSVFVKDSSAVWRTSLKGCINASGTWRQFITLSLATAPLGTCIEGGNLVYKSGGIAWIANPAAACIRCVWTSRANAITCSQTVTGCTGWFIPTCSQYKSPIWGGRQYICSAPGAYWTDTESTSTHAWIAYGSGPTVNALQKTRSYGIRAFRCVSY